MAEEERADAGWAEANQHAEPAEADGDAAVEAKEPPKEDEVPAEEIERLYESLGYVAKSDPVAEAEERIRRLQAEVETLRARPAGERSPLADMDEAKLNERCDELVAEGKHAQAAKLAREWAAAKSPPPVPADDSKLARRQKGMADHFSHPTRAKVREALQSNRELAAALEPVVSALDMDSPSMPAAIEMMARGWLARVDLAAAYRAGRASVRTHQPAARREPSPVADPQPRKGGEYQRFQKLLRG